MGDITQNARDLEKHQLGAIPLVHLAVDRQLDRQLVRILDPALFDPLGDRQEGIKSLVDAPGETLLLGFLLGVSCRHVDGQAVRVDGIVGFLVVVCRKVFQGLSYDQTEFDLVVEVHAIGADDRTGAGG